MTKPRTRAKGVEKIAISLPKELSDWIDNHAGTEWGARSKFIARLIQEDKDRESGSNRPRGSISRQTLDKEVERRKKDLDGIGA